MATLLEMIIFFLDGYLFMASQFPFDYQYQLIWWERKGSRYQGIRVFEAFEYENTRTNFVKMLLCKQKNMSDYMNNRDLRAILR